MGRCRIYTLHFSDWCVGKVWYALWLVSRGFLLKPFSQYTQMSVVEWLELKESKFPSTYKGIPWESTIVMCFLENMGTAEETKWHIPFTVSLSNFSPLLTYNITEAVGDCFSYEKISLWGSAKCTLACTILSKDFIVLVNSPCKALTHFMCWIALGSSPWLQWHSFYPFNEVTTLAASFSTMSRGCLRHVQQHSSAIPKLPNWILPRLSGISWCVVISAHVQHPRRRSQVRVDPLPNHGFWMFLGDVDYWGKAFSWTDGLPPQSSGATVHQGILRPC